jgi:hypothetical protein
MLLKPKAVSYSGNKNPAVAVRAMSQFQSFGRPFVEFDVRNKEHRRHFTAYLQTNAWGDCPYRFYVTGQIIPVSAMRQQMLEYYTSKEFGKNKVD